MDFYTRLRSLKHCNRKFQKRHVVNTSGHCAYYTAQMNAPQSHYTVIRDFGAIGNVHVLRPWDYRTLSRSSCDPIGWDGSVMIYRNWKPWRGMVNIMTVVLNDGGYGSEVQNFAPRVQLWPDQSLVGLILHPLDAVWIGGFNGDDPR